MRRVYNHATYVQPATYVCTIMQSRDWDEVRAWKALGAEVRLR